MTTVSESDETSLRFHDSITNRHEQEMAKKKKKASKSPAVSLELVWCLPGTYEY